MLYNFSYDQDLNSGDSIAIKLPFFSGHDLGVENKGNWTVHVQGNGGTPLLS